MNQEIAAAAGQSPAEVRNATGVTRSELRNWEEKNIIRPQIIQSLSRAYRRYPQDQVELAKKIKWLKGKGMTLKGAVEMLPELQRWEESNGKSAIPGTSTSEPKGEEIQMGAGRSEPTGTIPTP